MGKAGPRDVQTLAATLSLIPDLRELISQYTQLGALTERLSSLTEIRQQIETALNDDLPAPDEPDRRDRAGHSEELDGIYSAVRNAKDYVANLERVERDRTGIKELKSWLQQSFSAIYIEVSHANANLVPEGLHPQSKPLVNAERYITPTLKEYETLILNAEGTRALEIETRLFRELCATIAAESKALLETARALASPGRIRRTGPRSAARQGYVSSGVDRIEERARHSGRASSGGSSAPCTGERFVPNRRLL